MFIHFELHSIVPVECKNMDEKVSEFQIGEF